MAVGQKRSNGRRADHDKGKGIRLRRVMLNYVSSNTVKSLSGPQFYADYINPLINKFIKGQNKFYGVIAMDYADNSNYRMVFETNFNRLGINS